MAFVTILKRFRFAKNLHKSRVSSRSCFAVTNTEHRFCDINSIYLHNLILKNARSFHMTSILPEMEKMRNMIKKDSHQNIGLLSNNEPSRDDAITSADLSWMETRALDVLDPCDEDVSDICTFTSPSFNLAAYVNKSKTLQELVKMGVDLNRIEARKGAAECILKLDFDKHIKQHLIFLHDNGLPADQFGQFVTKNPFIFEQELDDLQIRINYLEAKKFTPSSITRIITRNPMWLNFNTIEIDKRLGFFQRTFVLSGEEVRFLADKRPRLITYDLGKVTTSLFAVKEDMGFNEQEIKALLLNKPKLFNLQTDALKSRFDYVHNVMEISHEQILQQPSILQFRNFIVKQRHEFLKEIGKAQYNPNLPGYVSLDNLVHGDDVNFCKNVAKTSIDIFNTFLKTR